MDGSIMGIFWFPTIVCCCWACGGRRTTGLLASTGRGGREITEPVGDIMKSLPIDDRRLIAMLGE